MFDVVFDLFGSLLRTLYEFFHSYGLAIIMFTFITRIIFIYFSAKGKRSTMVTQRLQPKIKELENKYKNDKVKYQQAVQMLYQKEGVNPMSGCLWSLIPLPIMILLYQILSRPLEFLMKIGDSATVRNLGSQLANISDLNLSETVTSSLTSANPSQLTIVNLLSEKADTIRPVLSGEIADKIYDSAGNMVINQHFLGLDLMAIPDSQGLLSPLIIIPLLAAAFTYLSSWMSQKISGVEQPKNMRFMFYMFPAMTFYFAYTMPAGIGLYWIAGSIYALGQDYFLTKHYIKVLDAEDAKKAELEAKRKAAEAAMKEELRQRRAEEIASGKRKKGTSYKLKQKPNTPKTARQDQDSDQNH